MAEPIVRIAARGEGATADGRHASFAVPGDLLHDDGSVEQGPHHQMPPCRHFPQCGGCQLQHCDDIAYRDYLASRIGGALVQHGIETRVLEPYLSPPRSRRRGSLRALKSGKSAIVGFNAAKSNHIVDLHECHVLRPELFALVAPLRELLGQLLAPKRPVEIRLVLADQGVDCLIEGLKADGMNAQLALIEFAQTHGIARLALDDRFGPETIYEPEPVTISLSGIPVRLGSGAFLQATVDGEAALVAAVREALSGAGSTADLFSGLGTFALAIGAAYAAEAGRDPAAALASAAPLMEVEHRDLYRRPLDQAELSRFAAVVLDPPRAGAVDQVAQLARSLVPCIAYVSCNPATFARDARTLVSGGYSLQWVKPVGQFRWSTHVELVAAFSR